MSLPFPPTALASSSSGVLVASGSVLHLLRAGAAAASSTPAAADAKAEAAGLVRKIAVSPDGTLAASAHDDKMLRVWNLGSEITLRSERTMFKRVASISFNADNSIVVTDKVGDVYLYPLEPREAKPQLQGFKLQADPSLNPDADFLLGHVSVVSQHFMAPDGKRIITADRDEHIRVSRFPKAYVIDKYLFGSEGFVSAIHIPTSRPTLLLSAGGEPTLQIWDWAAGKLLRRVEIWPAILPYRRVRPTPRRLRSKKKVAGADAAAAIAPSDDPADPGFYVAAEGSMYPTGQGVCVEKIDSVDVDGTPVALFFSEGCTALHSFVVDESDEKTQVHSQAFKYPVLGFTAVKPGQILVALDASYGVKKDDAEVDASRAHEALAVVQVAADGFLSDITSTSDIVAPLLAALATPTTTPATIAGLQLFPNLSLFPRWPGFEEDEELAGPAATAADLEAMNGKQLGRLKAQGAVIPEGILSKKAKKRKTDDKSKSASVEPKAAGEKVDEEMAQNA